jgi:hypothetical protein
MKLTNFSPDSNDWSNIAASVHAGASGTATERTRQVGELQLRLVEYSAGYVADHWCSKGHIVLVLSGDITIEHQDGREFPLTTGMSYHVGDDAGPPHRARSDRGATTFVVD